MATHYYLFRAPTENLALGLTGKLSADCVSMSLTANPSLTFGRDDALPATRRLEHRYSSHEHFRVVCVAGPTAGTVALEVEQLGRNPTIVNGTALRGAGARVRLPVCLPGSTGLHVTSIISFPKEIGLMGVVVAAEPASAAAIAAAIAASSAPHPQAVAPPGPAAAAPRKAEHAAKPAAAAAHMPDFDLLVGPPASTAPATAPQRRDRDHADQQQIAPAAPSRPHSTAAASASLDHAVSMRILSDVRRTTPLRVASAGDMPPVDVVPEPARKQQQQQQQQPRRGASPREHASDSAESDMTPPPKRLHDAGGSDGAHGERTRSVSESSMQDAAPPPARVVKSVRQHADVPDPSAAAELSDSSTISVVASSASLAMPNCMLPSRLRRILMRGPIRSSD